MEGMLFEGRTETVHGAFVDKTRRVCPDTYLNRNIGSVKSNALIDKYLLKVLLGGILFFAFANIFNQLLGSPFWIISRSIHLGFDDNIPAWYSSMLLLVAALMGLECFQVGKRLDLAGRWTFLVFSGLLVLLSCDEIARFHETIGAALGKSLGPMSSLAKHTPWLLIGAPIVLGVFVGFFLLLKKSLAMVPGSLAVLGTGFALIVVGGVLLEGTINWLNHDELQWLWEAEIIVEESLEMIGTIFIAYSLMIWRDGLMKDIPRLRIKSIPL